MNSLESMSWRWSLGGFCGYRADYMGCGLYSGDLTWRGCYHALGRERGLARGRGYNGRETWRLFVAADHRGGS